MGEPRNHANVGYAMILVSLSLVGIGILQITVGSDVLYSDQIQRAKTLHFEECVESEFGQGCDTYVSFVTYEKCVAERDLTSQECKRYQTWVESAIFEQCRSDEDHSSPECLVYSSSY